MKESNKDKLGKGIAKVSARDRVHETRDTVTGKRKVKVDSKTWIYTSFPTDQEAIENYRKVHGLTDPKGNK